MSVKSWAQRSLRFAGEQREVLTSSFSSLLLRVGGLIATFGMGVTLARALGPVDYGIYGLVIGISAVVMYIALLGTPQTAVRELSVRSANKDWPGIERLVHEFGTFTGAVSVALGLAAIAIAVLIGPPANDKLLYVFQGALLTPLIVLISLSAAELRGLGRMFEGQVIDILARPALVWFAALALLFAGTEMRAAHALWIQLGVTAIAAGVSFLWVRRAIPKTPKPNIRSSAIPWIGTALPLCAVDVLRQLDGTYGLLLMGQFASGAELGVYRVALSCLMLVGMPISILHIVQAPTISQLHSAKDKTRLQELLSTTSMMLTVAVGLITITCWLFGEFIISFVFGPAYASAWFPLFLLCLGQTIYGFFGMGPILLAMSGGERHLIKIYAFSVGLGILAAFPLIERYGASGAASAQILSVGLIALFSGRFARRTLGLDVTMLSVLLESRHRP